MNTAPFQVTSSPLTLNMIRDLLLDPNREIALSEGAEKAIRDCRNFLEKHLEDSDEPVYGINTGFGYLCNTEIEGKDLALLQENLIRSHATGMGDEVPKEIVRLMIFLKVKSLSFGYSGIRVEVVQRLIDFYNAGVLPVVYTQGSLGASGDLAPLAHLSLPLIGAGEVWWKGEKVPADEMLRELNLEPLVLQSKEGIALLNGTQFMLAYGLYILLQGQQLAAWANATAALSLDGFYARTSPFDPLLHEIRPHPGQIATAQAIRELREGSEIAATDHPYVQDPYCFRCIPQVHGASTDTLNFVAEVFSREMNSVTDNPNIFHEAGKILSGGNFHGQPLALALDYLAIALSELGSISERRVFQLLSGTRGLPLFLTENPGLNSGLMIAQYTAAAIASENKGLCMPSSVDTIPSSNGQEDHVSMGANAAVKGLRVLRNVNSILGIELFTASQALSFRTLETTSPRLEKVLEAYRKEVSPVKEDRILSDDMKKSASFLLAHSF